MQCILTALKAESDPMIDYFHLQRVSDFSFPVFSNGNLFLIGIGIGKRSISNRINHFVQTIGNLPIQFINIGIAGGKETIAEIGNLYCIHKIIDASLKKSFYPDILIKHPLEERVITTVDKEINDGGDIYNTLVDMEASEIFRVCSKIVPLQNLLFLKIVSDYMNFGNGKLESEQISAFIKVHLNTLDSFLDFYKDLDYLNVSILSRDDQNWIQNLVERLLLTKTQNINLIKIMKGFRVRNPDLAFPKIILENPTSKIKRNKIYKDICEKFVT